MFINFLLLIKHETVAEFRELYYRYYIPNIYRFWGFAVLMLQFIRHPCKACSPTVGCSCAAGVLQQQQQQQ
jgi:hypothetical protein